MRRFDFKMENDYFEDEDKCDIIDYENAMKVWRMKAKAVVFLCLLLKKRQKRQLANKRRPVGKKINSFP